MHGRWFCHGSRNCTIRNGQPFSFGIPSGKRIRKVTVDRTRMANMSQLLERLSCVLRELEDAAPPEQERAAEMAEPFLKRVAYRRIPFGSQQQALLIAESERDRALVAEFLQYSEHPAIRHQAEDALRELSRPVAQRCPSIQV